MGRSRIRRADRLQARGAVVALGVLVVLAACSSSSSTPLNDGSSPDGSSSDLDEPAFDIRRFDADSATVDNVWLPLVPGTTAVFEGLNEDGETETIVTSVSHRTRTVDGVECVIVIDRAYVNGELLEETFDWYAQDTDGNVWYMGENSNDYENGVRVGGAGSWESGLDIAGVGSNAIAGIYMKALPVAGDSYRQEYYAGEAEDEAVIVATDFALDLPDGSTVPVLQIRERNPLAADVIEAYKFYQDGDGLVAEEAVDGSGHLDRVDVLDQRTPRIDPADFTHSTDIDHRYLPLVPGTTHEYRLEGEDGIERTLIEVLDETRRVMGIDTRVVRDRVWLDDVLVEDTLDWYAQDDDGNVWYFGEAVDNYHYDDAGNLTGIDHAGAWEAGVEGAEPGIVMPVSPRVGDSYRQEYYAGEAEDLAAIEAVDDTLTLGDGRSYTVLKTIEWNPLQEDSTEYKYYGEGVGLVRETGVDGGNVVELQP